MTEPDIGTLHAMRAAVPVPADEAGTAASSGRAPVALPSPVTEFVGRDREAAEVADLVRGHRLVTMIGVGGIGKTRLAIHVARTIAADYVDGVRFVPLADVSLPAHVPGAVAGALCVSESPGRDTVDVVVERLDGRSLLLVLDNFEHVVSASPFVSRLLDASPGVHVIVTSRERLRLDGERTYAVPSLDLPSDPRAHDASRRSSAVALYAARARGVDPDFRLSEANADTVAELCRRLDGLPLAIELAAARSAELSPEDMLDQMGARLDVLGATTAELPDRQRTLRGAIAWSYERLSEDERRHFDYLGVFVAGAEESAAAAVVPGWSLEVALALVDKSLLVFVDEGERPRFAMLDTIRAFAIERLDEGGCLTDARNRHADWAASLVGQANSALYGPEQVAWLARLDSEQPNLRAALQHALETEAGELVGRMCSVLWRFWLARSYVSEGRGWLDAALFRFPAMAADLRAELFNGAAALAILHSDLDRATTLLEEGLELARAHGHEKLASRLVNNLAHLAGLAGDYERSVRLYQENLAVRRTLGDRHALGVATGNLGDMLMLIGELDRARELLEESISINEEIGHTFNTALGLHYLGEALLLSGDLAGAEERFEASRRLGGELGTRDVLSAACTGLGSVAAARGELAAAARWQHEGLRWALELRSAECITHALEELGLTAHLAGDHPGAVRRYGAAAAAREAFRFPRPPVYRRRHEPVLDLTRESLGDAAYDAAWSEGWSARPEDILGCLP